MAAAREDKAQEGWQRPGSQGLWVVMCASNQHSTTSDAHRNPFQPIQSPSVQGYPMVGMEGGAYDGAVSRGGGEGVVHRERSGPVA